MLKGRKRKEQFGESLKKLSFFNQANKKLLTLPQTIPDFHCHTKEGL